MSAEPVGFIRATLISLSSPGSISVPGVKAGDKLIGSWIMSTSSSGVWIAPDSEFESVITVDDEIQQTRNVSVPGATWEVLLLR